ncbi:hypothetical protein LCGC14_2077720, partial [marine sediment metagenome]
MANDRLYIECKDCKKFIMFLKYFPYGRSYTWDNSELEVFMLKHINCSKPEQTLHGDRCFNIFAESADYHDSRDWKQNWEQAVFK